MEHSIDVKIHPGMFKSERYVVVEDYRGNTREIIVDETTIDETLGRAHIWVSNIEGYTTLVCAHFPNQDGDTVVVFRHKLYPPFLVRPRKGVE